MGLSKAFSEQVPAASTLNLKKCPHCKVDTPNLTRQTQFTTNNSLKNLLRVWSLYVCNKCGGVVTAVSLSSNDTITRFYPSLDQIDEEIPRPAYDFLSQASDTIFAPAGSIMLAASSVDAMLKLKGYKDGSLYERINKAAKDHLITNEMATWAHRVRLDANDQRHADENAGLPSIDDARHTLEFAKALGQFLFVLPARVNRGLEEVAKGLGKT